MTRRVVQLRPSAASPLADTPGQIYSTGFGVGIRTQTVQESDEDSPPAKKVVYVIIKTGLLIPGDGEPVPDAALVIEGKVIVWVGVQADMPDEYTKSPGARRYSVPYLMPGLWDCHVHFDGMPPQDDGDDGAEAIGGFMSTHPATAGARLARGCWNTIQRGYTSLRDMAGLGCEVSKAIREGTIIGPNVYSAGACLSQTAGHGDVFQLPAGDVLLNLGVSHITPGHFAANVSCLVDGVDECRRGVRLQIRRGARVIKVFASGGVLSRDDDPMCAQFSPEELQCIVDEAARQGRVVAAHVHGKPGILAAVKAGVGSVEHVSFADEECVDKIKEKGIVYVATRTVLELIMQSKGKGLPKSSWEKAQMVDGHNLSAYKLAIQRGVTIALGTDTPPGFNMAMELEYAVAAGMTNLEAIKAATANGPLTLGPQAPKSGQLKVGYDADILGLTENPVQDVKILQSKDNIGWVWKGGKIYKGPGVGPWGDEY
jgi:imidazolonepropionase-like amidohydrolase